MKVFVVTMQALYHNSSYFEVIAVRESLQGAKAVLETSDIDFVRNLEFQESQGIDNIDFNSASLVFEFEDMQMTIKDKDTGMFEKYTITEMEVLK